MEFLQSELYILMYHQIAKPAKDAKVRGLFTTPSHFEWQLRILLKKKFNITTFQNIQKSELDISKKNIVLTFDDGSDCFYRNAYPILKKYKQNAVLYPVVGSLGGKDVVFQESANKSPVNIVDADKLKELDLYGIEIGSHLMNHIWLTKRKPSEIKYELEESKKQLEHILNKDIISIAYPYGDFNKKIIKQTSEAGYIWGTTTQTGTNIGENKLMLRRYSVKGNKLIHYLKFSIG